jgi:hypothetical protein
LGGVPGEYWLFADCNRNQRFDFSTDAVLKVVRLERVGINGTNPTSGGSTNIEIIYIPPNPDAVIVQGGAVTTETLFVLNLCHNKATSSDDCIIVRANTSGSVEAEDD